jgi:hypothetical protein
MQFPVADVDDAADAVRDFIAAIDAASPRAISRVRQL